MKHLPLLIVLLILIGCSEEGGVPYGELPCSEDIDNYITTMNKEYEDLLALNYKTDLATFTKSSSIGIAQYEEKFFNCVWQLHQESRDSYTDEHRSTIMIFSNSHRDITSTISVISKKEPLSDVDYEWLKYNFEREAKMLNNHRQATQKAARLL